MAGDRHKRLARLVKLQKQLQELHETRRAAHLEQASAAEREAESLARQFDAPDSFASLFPALYHDRIARALNEKERQLDQAMAETRKVAAARARVEVAGRAHDNAVRKHERATQEKALLELLEQRRKP
ncbi:hypothetical protein [Chelativorans intermedius]|uniref:Flagellar FliJ protein n=1 Tax=Chelativorans intermedius TaxID=515947 RepID=A0ABV6D8T0_9HYPH|nr:hypothetical protein [Chelativorans intermedius]MCT8997762.1 hypothetical protein [Chelativorans intermedius]